MSLHLLVVTGEEEEEEEEECHPPGCWLGPEVLQLRRALRAAAAYLNRDG